MLDALLWQTSGNRQVDCLLEERLTRPSACWSRRVASSHDDVQLKVARDSTDCICVALSVETCKSNAFIRTCYKLELCHICASPLKVSVRG